MMSTGKPHPRNQVQLLEVINIHKSYENAPLLCGLSLSVGEGETICLLGPSGSGKSTLLRIVSGLEHAEVGSVHWNGQDITSLPTHQRKFGLMFQDYALFPHLSVAGNVAFGLHMQNLSRSEITARVAESLAQVNLSGFERRRVTDLSGGEQQRVALARVLAPRPRLLMFDEPLGALDRTLRERLLEELRQILRSMLIPALYVTHDQEEAFAIADRVLFLNHGRIVRKGSPVDIFREPESVWVAQFLGLGNIVQGRVCNGLVDTPYGKFKSTCTHNHIDNEQVVLLLRPEGGILVDSLRDNCVSGIITDVIFRQSDFRVTLKNGLFFHLSQAPTVGAKIVLNIPPTKIQCLEK